MFDSYIVTRQGLLFYTSDVARQNERYHRAQAALDDHYGPWHHGYERTEPPSQQVNDRSVMRRVAELEKRLDELDSRPVDLKKLHKNRLHELAEALELEFDYLDKSELIELLGEVKPLDLRRAARDANIQL